MKPGTEVAWRGEIARVVADCKEHPTPHLMIDISNGESRLCVEPNELAPLADTVTAPSHYIVGGHECREVIAALGLDFDLGSAFKYIWRAGRKDGADEVTDLRKAVECIEHRIRLLTGAGR